MKKPAIVTLAAIALISAHAFAALDGSSKGAKDLFLLDDDSSKPAAKPADAPKADAPKKADAPQAAAPAEKAAKAPAAEPKEAKPTKQAAAPKEAAPPKEAAAPKQAAQPASTGAQPQRYMGLAYWVDLQTNEGQFERVPTSRVFKSGERIKLNFKPNKDGYLYVVTLAPSGKTETVFPMGGKGDNFVKAGQQITIPGKGAIAFRGATGEEQILVMLASQPIPELSPVTSKPSSDLKQTSNMVAFAEKKGAKDLVIEDDFPVASPSGGKAQQASYAVAPVSTLNEGKTVNLVIKLKHQ